MGSRDGAVVRAVAAPTNVAQVRFGHGAICEWSFVVGSLLTSRVFLLDLWFSSLH